MNEKNYYKEIIQEIKKIRESDLDQAVLLLKKELSMPYIPSEHEREMKELFKEYSISFDQKKMTMNREELLEILGEGIENGRQSLALTQISQFNWVGYEDTIQKILVSNTIANNAKTIFIESLIVQKLNYDFKIGELTVNPSKMTSIFDSKYCIENIIAIEAANIEDPIVKRIAMESFLIYISLIFPENLTMNYVNHVDEIILVSRALLGNMEMIEGNEVATKIFKTISKS